MFDNLPLYLTLTLPKRPCPLIIWGINSVLLKEKAEFPQTSWDLVFPGSSKSSVPHAFLSVFNLISSQKSKSSMNSHWSKYHITIEHPELEGIPWDHQIPTPGPTQDSTKAPTTGLTALSKHFLISGRLGAVSKQNLHTAPFASQIVGYHIQSILQPDRNIICLPWAVKFFLAVCWNSASNTC